MFDVGNWLDGLNEKQLEAVETNDSHMLILAGAGTGKTKTVVSKIGNILQHGLARPDEIMGLTFTNKAAKEMKARLAGVEAIGDIWLGTFHSVCVRLLRMYYGAAGLDANFIIADQSESYQVVKNAIKEAYPHITPSMVYKEVIGAISKLKDKGITYDSSAVPHKDIGGVDLGVIYKLYQENLRRSNLIDFDDIIVLTTKMLKENPDVRQQLHDKFKYLFVDEYQDTSVGQNELVKAIAGANTIVCCVGDEDQSIYSWRGANIDNILGFSKIFPAAKIVTLEKNYRSTTNIVDFAYSLIKQNVGRYDKSIKSVAGAGDKVKVVCCADCKSEANYVAQEITKLKAEGVALNDIAVLVRASFQNKQFEEAFNGYGIAYRIVDGVKFFERKEVKDLISYLRFAFSNKDEISFERIINTPKRGIGEKTVAEVLSRCKSEGKTPLQVLKDMVAAGEFRTAQTSAVEEFVSQMEGWGKDVADGVVVSSIVSEMAHQSGYMKSLKDAIETDPTAEDRIMNLQTLIGDVGEFDSVPEFLEYVALASQKDSEAGDDAVNVSTIHGAKGLEYKYVFCPGWEEGVFPSSKSLEYNSDAAIEEERRLGYVAITRARSGLTLLFANSRFTFGSWRRNPASRFVIELRKNAPSEAFENLHLDGGDEEEGRRFGGASGGGAGAGYSRFANGRSGQGGTRDYGFKPAGGAYGAGRFGAKGGKPASGWKKPDYNDGAIYSEPKFKAKVSSVSPSSFAIKGTADAELTPISAGCKIEHATFGTGTVERLLGNFAEVVFEGTDGKRLIHRNFIKAVK